MRTTPITDRKILDTIHSILLQTDPYKFWAQLVIIWAELNIVTDDVVKVSYTPNPGGYGQLVQTSYLTTPIPYHDVMDVYSGINVADILKTAEPPQKQAQSSCLHEWRTYQGFTETYEYCTKCDMKRTARQ